MAKEAEGGVYVTWREEPGERVVLEAQQGRERRCWIALGRDEARKALREFIDWAGAGPLICYEASGLRAWLTDPWLVRRSRALVAAIEELQLGAFIVAASAPDFDLASIAHHLDVSAGQDELAILPALREALQARLQALPRSLQIMLATLNQPGQGLDWLPWPSLTLEERRVPLAHLERVLPPVRKSERRPAEGRAVSLTTLMATLFSPDGALARVHPRYEEREAQIQMAEAVASAFEDDGLLIVEAGTGIGKTLAYLVPALLWARAHNEVVLVSTNTRNLQEQIWAQDLPLLAKALPVAFRAALLKGRNNYLCLRALAWLYEETLGSLFWVERLAVMYLLAWLAAYPEGDLERLSPTAVEKIEPLGAFAERIRAEGEACLGRACPYGHLCAVERARETAQAADLVIVNHALVLAGAEGSVLPPYARIIFDEAHNIEAAATEGLAVELSSPLLASFARRVGVRSAHGSLAMISRRLNMQTSRPEAKTLKESLVALGEGVERLLQLGDELGEELFQLVAPTEEVRGEGERRAVRLTPAIRESTVFADVQRVAEAFISEARMLAEGSQKFAEDLREIEEQGGQAFLGLSREALAIGERATRLAEAGERILSSELEENMALVSWAETWDTRSGPAWRLCAAPVEIGPLLDTLFYRTKKTLVFTSATLSVEGDFRYFKRRMGLFLEPERLAEQMLPSPFDFEHQLLLLVPTDLPDPSCPEFDQEVAETVAQICALTGGGTLVLFTARARMEKAFAALEPRLRGFGLRPLCQDLSGPRSWLLEQLRQHEDSVLFGLKSFWEGVDVPGEALRCVVLAKLPFAVPDDPLVEARAEQIRRQGGDPMHDYYIPEAIVGFKQGVGRLIRTQQDRGIVFVLDPRLCTRAYGRRFLRSIPPCAFVRGPLASCLAVAEEWLTKETAKENSKGEESG